LLRGVFPYSAVLLENHVAGLLIADPRQAEDLQGNRPRCFQKDGAEGPSGEQRRQLEAFFLIALCSAVPLPDTRPMLLVPSTGNLLRERETHIHLLKEQLSESRREREIHVRLLEEQRDAARNRVKQLELEYQERTRWAQELDCQLAEKNAYVQQLQSQYDSDVGKARADLAKLQREFEDRTAWALRLNRELEFLYGTRWYRLGRKLGLKLDPPEIQTGSGEHSE
jgi:hypothetical protein